MIRVTVQESSCTVTSEMRVSDSHGNQLSLTNGDQLTATADGTNQQLTASNNGFNETIYQTNYNFAPTSSVQVALTRNDDSDAPNSTVQIPPAFNITYPANSNQFQGNDTIDISWAITGKPTSMELATATTCDSSTLSIRRTYSLIDSTGSYALPVSQILTPFNQPTQCLTTLTITKQNSGTLDANYTGGYINAYQVRDVTVSIFP